MLRERDRPRLWRATFAVVGWATLVLQYILMVGPSQGWGVIERTVNYFSFFTILTNILVALAFTGPLIDANRRLARWSASEGVRAAVAMYIVVVGVVYHVLLAPHWKPEQLCCQIAADFHSDLFRMMALSRVISLWMRATRMTLAGFPLSARRCFIALSTGLQRAAATAAI